MCEEDKDMSTTLNKKYSHLKNKLNSISANAKSLEGKDGMIELDPTNKDHVGWYEDESYESE